MSARFLEGEMIVLEASFSASGDPVVPQQALLRLKSPGGETEVYEVEPDGQGRIRRAVHLDAFGTWYWRWEASDSVVATTQGSFEVARAIPV